MGCYAVSVRCALFVLLMACGSSASTLEQPAAVVEHHALGMNDVSILLPLPRDLRTPVLATIAGDGPPLVDREPFDALVTARHDIAPKTGAAVGFDNPGP